MELKPDHKKIILELAQEFGVTKLLLFGSSVDQTKYKDIDLACEGLNDKRFFTFGARLESELKMQVDLVPLTPETRFVKHIKKHGRFIYG